MIGPIEKRDVWCRRALLLQVILDLRFWIFRSPNQPNIIKCRSDKAAQHELDGAGGTSVNPVNRAVSKPRHPV